MTQGLNDRILDLASTLAESCGATLHLLNVDGIDRFIGSTAESVLNRSPSSLTIVKPLPRVD
ncbi:hypothetical protein BK662_30050 [Pseudomonas frederiksbergensis]|uniref:UspA domain-containing protein n=1 Tax=Pseudomonas frederiksbergensis TaxID=104087 RepID=A0A423HG66_9PSED|nr:hypothetical protein BK662_30050 [Pseudomonas frederiksbergensis]